jgi:V8-like Glu-specific endopeptidase
LLQGLRAREAKAKNIPLARERSEDLREFDDKSLVNALKANQKVIYGTDDRTDVFLLPVGLDRDDVDSVVALFSAAAVTDNGNGTSTLQTQNFGAAQNLCAGERFQAQPIGAFCSGFLVAPDVIATAGHCVNSGNVTNARFVFGFRMRDATTAETIINNGEIYRGVAVIGRQEVGGGADWALVRIDRRVNNHPFVQIRRTGKIGDTQTVHVIGHPSGLPTKFAGGAAVRDNNPNAFFVANLDTYGGNSGFPVFNTDTHVVEGILVRGEAGTPRFVPRINSRISSRDALVTKSHGPRAEKFFPGVSQHCAGGGISIDDPSIWLCQKDSVRHTREEQLQ